MNREDRSERFSGEVDRLLRENHGDDSDSAGADFQQDLILAAELAGADYSGDSPIRASLRQHLLQDSLERRVPLWDRLSHWMQGLRHPRLSFAGVLLALVLSVLVAHPGLRAEVVEPAIKFLKRVAVGEKTEVGIREPEDFNRAAVDSMLDAIAGMHEAGQMWSLWTAVSKTGGGIPPGEEPVIRTYCSLSLAEAAAGFSFLKPTYLPEHFRFDRVSLTPGRGVVLWYLGPYEISLALFNVQTRTLPDGSQSTSSSMYTSNFGDIDEVAVGEYRAAWMGQALIWEQDGFSCGLEGRELTKDEALKIAGSLRR